MSFRNLEIKHNYFGNGVSILNSFLIPVLSNAVSYDRLTSFYTIDSLLSISQGIGSLFKNGGRMRLIIGIHSVPIEILDAVSKSEAFNAQISEIRETIKRDIASLTDLLEKKRIATIAWMIEDGLLEIRVVDVAGDGIFHPKMMILDDANGDSVAAIGSPNETKNGLGSNVEQLAVSKSWEIQDAVNEPKRYFESLWFNKFEGVYCLDITGEIAEDIRTSLGQGFDNPNKKKKGIDTITQVISASKRMPAYYFVSGDIPALYMHQERAVLDALSRWPVRVLLADEVGLGKTFEAAATMVFLIKNCGVKRTVILTPKSVLKQWQEELNDNFGLKVWMYDSSRKEYVHPDGRILSMHGKNPIGPDSPDMILMSAQFARGSGNDGSLLEREDTILPDLLMVDEAHSARVSRDITGKRKKTRMYKMLEAISLKVPHLIFATATPMQTDSAEYHALLKLLGLPKKWEKERAFRTSLRLIGSEEVPDISDGNSAAKMLCSTIHDMRPKLEVLYPEGKEFIETLVDINSSGDSYDVGSFVINNWSEMRKAFIRLHPARLLTVRNTRRALSEVGYQFPKRNLTEVSVSNSDEIQLFYQGVNEYITKDCFLIERALEPEKVINLGFIRVNYQQRVASSLHSCKESLGRRYNRVLQLREYLLSHSAILGFESEALDINESLDDIEKDELLDYGDENLDIAVDWSRVDIDDLRRAVSIECTSLGSLVSRAEELLKEPGDVKIIQSIELAKERINLGDTVLLFSRYTDTVDALIQQFEHVRGNEILPYGIYTGKKSAIIKDGKEEQCDKGRIKKELFAGNIKIMFCSDAASEGLNLQAARVLINVDVPWTPSRLEQRIGRIARLGQTAKEVDVYNVWYPNSIEARMYHRIQKRLDETNLAIGEFPEVVANRIKEAVLDDSDYDDSIQQLNDLRNSYQMKALEKLWVNTDGGKTISSAIRDRLVELAISRFEEVNVSGNMHSIELPDKTVFNVTADSGVAESISLSSPIWGYTDFAMPNVSELYTASGIPAAFYSNQHKCLLKPKAIFDLAAGEPFSDEMKINEIPNTLADNKALSLCFIEEGLIDEVTELWPPVMEKNNED
ncbi:MAG TPA: DEAD/DEAH box helicase family protein [Clostridiaceae bacterium]|nr:DEAD/DEAH box helicase family protein [Clostridiaceae bacterium]